MPAHKKKETTEPYGFNIKPTVRGKQRQLGTHAGKSATKWASDMIEKEWEIIFGDDAGQQSGIVEHRSVSISRPINKLADFVCEHDGYASFSLRVCDFFEERAKQIIKGDDNENRA